MSTFNFIDLFSGIGGFKIALSSNGGNCVGFSEVNKDAISTYCENHKISRDMNFGDITKITTLPNHDILTAGVPCQSWSIAGKNLGFDDDRGQLWNDTIFILNEFKPKAFIFENVKGLVDPRNKTALTYILNRIKEAGYHAQHYVINSHDYGVAQNRVRVYIIGFREYESFIKFKLPDHAEQKTNLADIVGVGKNQSTSRDTQVDSFDNPMPQRTMSLSSKKGFNDYFLFNDLRNGHTTIHSWDITDTTERQKEICLLLLKNRRKRQFGPLDGNPLSLEQFKTLDPSISTQELNDLVGLNILKKMDYLYKVLDLSRDCLDEHEKEVLTLAKNNLLNINSMKGDRGLKIKRIPINRVLTSLVNKGFIKCIEERFDFKNTKISSGLNGINRIFMPTSDLFPTLVASDSNDYISLEHIEMASLVDYKRSFLENVYRKKKYRKITKQEACKIQGFPKDFKLPESRSRWMKLIGNSVSVPVVDALIKAIIATGVFDKE